MTLALPGTVNRGNAAQAVAAAVALGASPSAAVAAVSAVDEVAGRYRTVQVGEHTVRILLAKNPAGWQESLSMVSTDVAGAVISVNGQVPDGEDLSWLWDVNFEHFVDFPAPVVSAGERGTDLAVRLGYAGVDHTLVHDTLAAIKSCPPGHVEVIANYTAFLQLNRELGMTVRIGLVLPDVMGTYGDSGNAVVLRQRLRLRGIDAEIVEITLNDPVPDSLDLYTLGGAEDYAQRLATKHLIRYPGLQQAVSRGAPVLAICAAIQVLGHWYETSSGERVEGVGLLDVTTSPQAQRTIGEVASVPVISGLSQKLTGFENHRGGTDLGPLARPLARVEKGAGNRSGTGFDGVVQGSVVATYLHGCALARNPELADYLLAQVVGELPPLELSEVDQLRRERLAAPRRA